MRMKGYEEWLRRKRSFQISRDYSASLSLAHKWRRQCLRTSQSLFGKATSVRSQFLAVQATRWRRIACSSSKWTWRSNAAEIICRLRVCRQGIRTQAMQRQAAADSRVSMASNPEITTLLNTISIRGPPSTSPTASKSSLTSKSFTVLSIRTLRSFYTDTLLVLAIL